MEGNVGEIRMFAGNFAPRSWAFCNGQLMSIAQNQALFSILGTTYGGDGRTTFALPDLRGRVAISEGTGPGLSTRKLGSRSGTETVTLTLLQMPSHTHVATVTSTGGVSGTAKIKVGDTPTSDNPEGAYPAALKSTYDGDSVETLGYAAESSGSKTLADDCVELNISGGKLTGVMNYPTGGYQPHNNMQPYLVVNYIICLFGYYPSRN